MRVGRACARMARAVRGAEVGEVAIGARRRRRARPAPSAPTRRRASTGRRSRARRADRPGCSRRSARRAASGGSSRRIRPASRSTSCASSAAIAGAAAPRAPRPDSTAHACAIRSMRHSSLACEPSGVPSSKKARRNHSPSQPAPCSASRQPCAASCQRAARASSPRCSAIGAKRATSSHRNQPSHTDSPRPFVADAVHAVVPVAGAHQRQAVRADARLRSIARAQCS